MTDRIDTAKERELLSRATSGPVPSYLDHHLPPQIAEFWARRMESSLDALDAKDAEIERLRAAAQLGLDMAMANDLRHTADTIRAALSGEAQP